VRVREMLPGVITHGGQLTAARRLPAAGQGRPVT
jgi:hypothetical protein